MEERNNQVLYKHIGIQEIIITTYINNSNITQKTGGKTTISSQKPSLRTLAGKKLEEIEKYAIQTTSGKKLITTMYRSDAYNYFSKKIDKFRDFKLIEDIKKYPVPNHIAVIMDGNRRFAKSLGLTPEMGHLFGRDTLKEVLDWCFEVDIKILTVYAFSTENFKRNKSEVKTLMDLCKQELDRAKKDSRIHKNKVKIQIIGHLESLPKDIQESTEYIMQQTKKYDGFKLNIALAYGGREEILQAIQQIAEDVKEGDLSINEINENTMSSYLYTNGIPDPDLILRTSGEERISNFLLWQLAYSELYFSDVYWPAFKKRDFLKAINTYQNRKRRFGK